MRGTHEFHEGYGPDGAWPFAFRVTWGPKSLRSWLSPRSDDFMRGELRGEVMAGGLCEWTPCEGTIELDYIREHRIRYDFRFRAAGKALRFVGDKKNIKAWNLPVSHTTCFGVITEAASHRLVSTSVSLFRFRDLPAFIAAWRLHRE